MSYTSRITKNTALTQAELDNNFLCHYPVGSLYLNALNDNSPGDIIGYGRWSLFAQGYTLLSSNSPRERHEEPDGWNNTPRQYAESLPRTSLSSSLKGSIENGENQTDGYYSPGFQGGATIVKVNDYPKHNHILQDTQQGSTFVDGQYRGRTDYNGFYAGNHFRGVGNNPMTAARIGGGSISFANNVETSLGHNNIQKYITINIWKRDI